jgi:undecaprenyl-diphosphatase
MIEGVQNPSGPSGSRSRFPSRAGVPALAAWIAAALAFVVFAVLAWSVQRKEPSAFDTHWLAAFRSAGNPAEPLGPIWLEGTLRDFTALGSYGVLVTFGIVALAFLLLTRQHRQGLVFAVAVSSGMLMNHLMKLALSRPRPEVVDHLTMVHTHSFPSGHAMLSMLFYLMLAMALVRGQASTTVQSLAYGFAALLAVIVGISRVYLGVHWPTDVIAGWALGLGWALLFWHLDSWLQRRAR